MRIAIWRAVERHDRDVLAGAGQVRRIVVESRHLRGKEGPWPGIGGPGARGVTMPRTRRSLLPIDRLHGWPAQARATNPTGVEPKHALDDAI